MSTTPSDKTILIADDDPAQRLLVEAALAGAGFVVVIANDGLEAVESYTRQPADCVVLDVNMPNMTGFEACRAIRQCADGRLLPILMLTGRNDLSAITEAFAAGASDFAQKGLNPRLLVERVRFLLRDRELRDELWSSRSKLLLAQRIARMGHWEIDTEGHSISVSPFVEELLGPVAQPQAGYEGFIDRLDADEQPAVRQAFRDCVAGRGAYSFDHRVRVFGEPDIWIHQEAELVVPEGSTKRRVVIVTLQDTTRLRRAEEAVHTLSYFDAPTGLPNHRHLAEQIEKMLKEDAGAQAFGVIAFRYHGFDRIVQAQGAEFANALLAQVARGIETELSGAVKGGATIWRSGSLGVCRTGEGELAIVLRSRLSVDHLAGVTEAILSAVSRPTQCLGTEFVPALSAGIAVAPRDGNDSQQLIGNAHIAAEQAGDARTFAFFSAAPRALSRRRLLLEAALQGALERHELHLVYQPRVAIDTLELSGVEALLRWSHPQFGVVGPDEFIPIAEENGSIEEIGQWVLSEACRQVLAWRERFRRNFGVSTNLSGRQLRNPELVGQVKEALITSGLPANALEIELTETSIVESVGDAREKLGALRRMGVRIAIDDFGVGYSSLGQIRQLPFDCMKLDRALIADLYVDLGAQGVTAAVIAMARALRIRSVAEGIEDAETLTMLRALGCDEIQGHYVSPALATADFEAWLEAGGASALIGHDVAALDATLGGAAARAGAKRSVR
jgi:EAL domain-containing protein (putative c-di-GMP-specific phosphodiesterase class I)/DNA-binding response OmpR family regulator/GGDEF domain-containing protein